MKKPRKANKSVFARKPSGFRRALEVLEAREVPATGFLQGTAYIDSNNDGQFGSGDSPKAGALIQLERKQSDGSFSFVANATADSGGYYRFIGLDPATYRLSDITAGYIVTGASFESQFYPASVTPQKSIIVDLVDTSAIQATYVSRPLYEQIQMTLNGATLREFVSQRILSVTGGGLGSSTIQFYTFCTNLNQDLAVGAKWIASTQPADSSLPGNLPFNSERISYLYNTYGTTLRSSHADAAGLQIAIWELEYDSNSTPPSPADLVGYTSAEEYFLRTGNYRYNFLYGTPSGNSLAVEDAAVFAAAKFYLQDSLGKDEAGIFLRADSSISNGLQSMIATGSYDFLNIPTSKITGKKYTDKTADGITPDDTPLAGVEIQLFAGNSATGTPLQSTFTDSNGNYVFSGLAPGSYFVQEVVPAESTQTAGQGGYPITFGGSGKAIGSTASGNDFANFRNVTISGVKFNDVNGNGARDGGDAGLQGWTIFLDTNNNSALDSGEPSTVTDTNGEYSFTNLPPGNYVVREVNQSGWLATLGKDGQPVLVGGTGFASGSTAVANFGNFQLGSISGIKFEDTDGSGSLTGNEAGLAGWTIFLDTNDNGLLDSGEVSTVTGAGGSYSFTNLPAGTYTVREVEQSGWLRTSTNPAAITILSGTAAVASFGNFKLGSISGVKTLDLTNNGFSNDDVLLENVSIQLYQDANNNGLLDPSEAATPFKTGLTDTNGAYSFTDLPFGRYFVKEVIDGGYVQSGGLAVYSVLVTSGTVSNDNNFANFRPGTISGVKYNDLNGNGIIESGDVGLAGITINLFRDDDGNGLLDAAEAAAIPVATATTGSGGAYSFTGLIAGDYIVREAVLSGSVTTVGAAGYAVTVDPAILDQAPIYSGNIFANFQRITVSGRKFVDRTGDGFTVDDTPRGGVQIELYVDVNRDGLLTDADLLYVDEAINVHDAQPTYTAADGSYSFTNLPPGSYLVKEVVPAGWIQTAGPEAYSVIATSGANVSNLDFGNFQTVGLSGIKYRDLTGNGIDVNDPVLGGVTIELYKDGQLIDSVQTSANGAFSFVGLVPGTYLVKEVVPPGSTQTAGIGGYTVTVGGNGVGAIASGGQVAGLNFANFTPSGTISGFKYLDRTGNGYSSDDTGHAGTIIYLDTHNFGQLDPDEQRTTTASDGSYSFTNLTAGTYIVREVLESGYIRTGPVLVDNYTVNLGSSDNVSGLNFTNFRMLCAECTFTDVSFFISHVDGTTEVVSNLRGETREGDVITVTFTINPPAGTTQQVTFASYTAPENYFNANTASQQQIYEIATGAFAAGTHTLTIHVPNSNYQVDFVCGFAIDVLGPAGSNIFYTPQKRLKSADNGGTHNVNPGAGSISGYKFNDVNGNGTWDPGEQGLKNWVIYVDANNNGRLDAGEYASVTDANGYYKISNLVPGTLRVREVLKAGWFQSAGAGDTLSLTSLTPNKTGVNFGNYQGATLTGVKFHDRNADGVWDKDGLDNCLGNSDDETGLAGWKIYVDYDGDGVLDADEPWAVTDSTGAYRITGVKVGSYEVAEVMQAGWLRTTNVEAVCFTANGLVTNVNIGNFKGSLVMAGDTATIGFWNNKNGQALIKSLNGNSNSKALGNWLASNFPNLFGSQCGSNSLAGKTNSQVAAYFQTLFKVSGQKLAAQVLATALAVYVTDKDLAGGNYGTKYGFNVDSTGVGDHLFDIGSNGAAFGVENGTLLTVRQILNAANARAYNGNLWYGNTTLRNMGNVVFTGINEQGDIG